MRRQVADSRRTPRFENKAESFKGTDCYGCIYCEYRLHRRRFYDEERYWCNKRHCYERNPWTLDCPYCVKEDE